MPLPDLIEIVPLSEPVQAEITVPGSKSITNRALVLAALSKNTTVLQGALWSEDTQVMVECLQQLGFTVKVELDAKEFCNRTITVFGEGGKIPNAGTEEKPLELFVGNAGTAARFLSALVCLGNGVYRLHGVLRMHDRPQAALFKALRQLGYKIDSANDKMPVVIHGTGPRRAKTVVSIEHSSQFASALLLCKKSGNWNIEIVGENAEESPYVAMTFKLLEAFPENGGSFQIEPDASSGSYFLAASDILGSVNYLEYSEQFGVEVETRMLRPIKVSHWPESRWQVDEEFPKVLDTAKMVNSLLLANEKSIPGTSERIEKILQLYRKHVDVELSGVTSISRNRHLGDSIMTAIVLAPFGEMPVSFTDLGRLRVQECERVEAIRVELTKCGAKVIEDGDKLTVFPSKLHSAEIETYNDHRMAMCFAILGLKIPGIRLKNPACVKKTFPNFFQKLAANPPAGLGSTIVDSQTGQPLSGDGLFAD